jgi:ribonuclease P protein component
MSKFSKAERLCSKKHIDKLFSDGKSFIKYPLRITYLSEKKSDTNFCQVLIIVPKKRLKTAIDRNLVKRRIREAYRTNKTDINNILKEKELHISMAILYVSNEVLEFQEIKSGIQKALENLNKEVVKTL